jgi:hypothetical protein
MATKRKLTPEAQAREAHYEKCWAEMRKIRHLERDDLHDSRICFGISYWMTEEAAMEADRIGRLLGNEYNGGWFHGMACGRDRSFDKTLPDGTKVYAVTV